MLTAIKKYGIVIFEKKGGFLRLIRFMQRGTLIFPPNAVGVTLRVTVSGLKCTLTIIMRYF